MASAVKQHTTEDKTVVQKESQRDFVEEKRENWTRLRTKCAWGFETSGKSSMHCSLDVLR
jgi:hypothetical protein